MSNEEGLPDIESIINEDPAGTIGDESSEEQAAREKLEERIAAAFKETQDDEEALERLRNDPRVQAELAELGETDILGLMGEEAIDDMPRAEGEPFYFGYRATTDKRPGDKREMPDMPEVDLSPQDLELLRRLEDLDATEQDTSQYDKF